MTEDELKKIAQEVRESRWDYPGLVITEGRYYDRKCLINLPPEIIPPFGGDMMAMIWRFNETPNEWICTWRIRYNAGHNVSPWLKPSEGGDRKSWNAFRHNEGEKTRREMVAFLETLPLRGSAKFKTEPLKIDWLVIQGDAEKFMEVAKREKKPWMHIRTEELPK